MIFLASYFCTFFSIDPFNIVLIIKQFSFLILPSQLCFLFWIVLIKFLFLLILFCFLIFHFFCPFNILFPLFLTIHIFTSDIIQIEVHSGCKTSSSLTQSYSFFVIHLYNVCVFLLNAFLAIAILFFLLSLLVFC